MLRIENAKYTQFRASSLGKTLRIFSFQFKHYCNEMKLIYSTFGKEATPQQINELCPEYFDRTITSTVFTGMVIEALLYDYAVVQRSKTYANKVSKNKLNLEFTLIVKDIFKKQGNEESLLSTRLEKLKEVRNHFVHNKSTEMDEYNKDLDYLSPDGCLELLIDLLEYFVNLDSEYILFPFMLEQLKALQVMERGF